ncbi:MAG: hypothetical protein JO125_12250 [Chloroflexi bacterium]|nr:hypothetical protein [Ktedonobacteraceae bacterium]MBV9708168.1 hypothetical protein [Chloroflexota bacterium]
MQTQPPDRLAELEKAFAIFQREQEVFQRKYRDYERDVRSTLEGHSHYITMTFGMVQTQEKDIREIKSTLNEHTYDIREIKSTLNEHTYDIKEIKSTLGTHTQDIGEIKSTQGTHTKDIAEIKFVLREHMSVLNKHGAMLEHIISLLKPKE